MKFEKIQAGVTLLDIHSERMGNTTMRELGLWTVKVISVDPATRSAMVRWNGNPERRWSARQLEKLVVKPGKSYLDQQERKMRSGGYVDPWLRKCRPELFEDKEKP
jgi:hypothetical protein